MIYKSAVMTNCPFYGSRWPDHTPALWHAGGNECGLDIDTNGPCAMEADGRNVNYFSCPLVQAHRQFFEIAGHLIKFETEDGTDLSLAAWERREQS